MNIRELEEKLEVKNLSRYATLSSKTRGRILPERKCRIRTDFQRDRDRIIHSKSFRRLKHKTQVFIAPEGDHFRTRLTHTLEVSQIARTIGRALRLNEDLIEAISLGHDLGHTPFGHTGERVLYTLTKGEFTHNKQSLRVVDKLESTNYRVGLNLTAEVRDGILNHSGDSPSLTLEGKVVKYADRIAYINHDIDDAIRSKVINEEDLPKECIDFLGETSSDRINTMILDIINKSYNKPFIKMSKECLYYTENLRTFLFDRVYLNNETNSQERKARHIIEELFTYYMNYELPKKYFEVYGDTEVEKKVMICDYIAGMTDRYIINKFKELFIPESWDKY